MATQLLLIFQIALSRMKWSDATAMESMAHSRNPKQSKPENEQPLRR
jgi:hypothetical protein